MKNESCASDKSDETILSTYFTDAIGGRSFVRFVSKDHQTRVPEDTPPGSVLLTTGVNKVDPVSNTR